MGKTPSYVKDAVKAYRDKNEFIQVKVSIGTKEAIKHIIGEKGTMSEYCNVAIMAAIKEDMERMQGDRPEAPQMPQIVPKLPEPEKTTMEPENPENGANSASEDTWTEEEQIVALQAELEARRAEMQECKNKLKENALEENGLEISADFT